MTEQAQPAVPMAPAGDGGYSVALLRALERQRNESLAQNAHKDALIAMMQGQMEACRSDLKKREATIAQLTEKLSKLEAEKSAKKKAG